MLERTTLKILSFEKTVAASATPERLSATHLYCRQVTIEPLSTNTDEAFCDQGATPALLLPRNFGVTNGEQLIDLYEFFVRVAVDGEGVLVIYSY